MSFFGNLFSKEKKESLDQGLQKSKESFFGKLGKAIAGKSTVDEEVLDNLEESLISSDVGVDTTLKIIQRIQARVARDHLARRFGDDGLAPPEAALARGGGAPQYRDLRRACARRPSLWARAPRARADAS